MPPNNLYTALSAYGNIERVKGSGCEATSVEIAKKYFTNPDAAVVAYSRNFPDGLCGTAAVTDAIVHTVFDMPPMRKMR